jgi:hypothetical protein
MPLFLLVTAWSWLSGEIRDAVRNMEGFGQINVDGGGVEKRLLLLMVAGVGHVMRGVCHVCIADLLTC